MMNLQDFIANNESYKKFQVDDLLFVEYKSPVKDASTSIWWHNNFFSFILTGEMALKTPQHEYVLKPGDCAFVKKGCVIASSHLRKDFCEILVFVPDDFIRSVVQKYKMPLTHAGGNKKSDVIIPLTADDILVSYFHSLLAYFLQPVPPTETLLKLKFEELLVNILSNKGHLPLQCYLGELCASSKLSIKEIMETNFYNNLSLEEFARLCARSLSAFKLEFKGIYNTTPGKWLQEKRLEYSRFLLETTNYSIDEICIASGFENNSHFIRVFKNKYGLPPGKFKIQAKYSLPKEIFKNSIA